ncbi:recombinase family protein, partial [Rubrivirga sp.]|uniref:recombinase family protein n=1 Tax=Rubrivirga sp. TaxID=1885344 RepID=UPI003C721EAF
DGLRAFAGRAGLTVVAAYTDVAVSGRKEGRPDLDRLMASARRRELDCVLVWKFDRFARSVSHLVRALDEFDHLGVRFVSVQDNVDTTSPMGRAMFAVIGAMAELESALIAERVQAGMAAAKARGRHVGRPATDGDVAERIAELARTTDLSVRKIHAALAHESGDEASASRSVVGRIVKQARAEA